MGNLSDYFEVGLMGLMGSSQRGYKILIKLHKSSSLNALIQALSVWCLHIFSGSAWVLFGYSGPGELGTRSRSKCYCKCLSLDVAVQ